MTNSDKNRWEHCFRIKSYPETFLEQTWEGLFQVILIIELLYAAKKKTSFSHSPRSLEAKRAE